MLQLVFVLLLGLACSASSSGCPPDEDISPCTCITNDLDVDATLTCLDEGLTQGALQNILKKFDGRDVLAVELSGLRLDDVPADFFRGARVKRLEFWDCRVEGFGDTPFTGLEDTLEMLIISSTITDEDGDFRLNLGHLNQLAHLELDDNSIAEIGDDWFRGGPASLAHLVLSNNGIGRLGRGAFAGLANLKTLFMDGNRFGALSRSMLPVPATKLVELYLHNNALTRLPADMFSGMPSLEVVSLRDNGLTAIDEETFGAVWEQLEKLDMTGNSLECDAPRLEWMFHSNSLVRVSGECEAPPEKKGVQIKDILSRKVLL